MISTRKRNIVDFSDYQLRLLRLLPNASQKRSEHKFSRPCRWSEAFHKRKTKEKNAAVESISECNCNDAY